MRRLLIPAVTLLCLCCATLPRQTRTDVQVLAGGGKAEWVEPYSCGNYPQAHQLDDQLVVGLAVRHENANGFEAAATVEGMRENVTGSVSHPTPPDGARDYLIGGGGYAGFRREWIGSALGFSAFPNTWLPYGLLELGALDTIWVRFQIGRWRPLSDTRIATVGLAFRPVADAEAEIWTGLTSAAMYQYPVASRVPGQGTLGETDWGGGVTFRGQANDYFGLFAQIAASAHPSGFVGISITPFPAAPERPDDPEAAP